MKRNWKKWILIMVAVLCLGVGSFVYYIMRLAAFSVMFESGCDYIVSTYSWVDVDGNGLQDGSDYPLSGVTFTATGFEENYVWWEWRENAPSTKEGISQLMFSGQFQTFLGVNPHCRGLMRGTLVVIPPNGFELASSIPNSFEEFTSQELDLRFVEVNNEN